MINYFKNLDFKSVKNRGRTHDRDPLTSSRDTVADSRGTGRGTDSDGPGRDTLDRRLFLTPLQLLGILKAHRL